MSNVNHQKLTRLGQEVSGTKLLTTGQLNLTQLNDCVCKCSVELWCWEIPVLLNNGSDYSYYEVISIV